jgi:hypothetical protein
MNAPLRTYLEQRDPIDPEIALRIAAGRAFVADLSPLTPRFAATFCSMCGRDFGPGEHGYSTCESHDGKWGR